MSRAHGSPLHVAIRLRCWHNPPEPGESPRTRFPRPSRGRRRPQGGPGARSTPTMNRRRASLGAFAVGASALALAVSPLPTTFAADGDAGRIYVAGSAAHLGEPGEASSSITGLAATPSGRGYWTVAENGDVAAFGDARNDLGRPPALAHPLVDVAGTRSGNGYWLAARDGGVFA